MSPDHHLMRVDAIMRLKDHIAAVTAERDEFRRLYRQAAEVVLSRHPQVDPFDQFVRRVFEAGFNAAPNEQEFITVEQAFREWLKTEAWRS